MGLTRRQWINAGIGRQETVGVSCQFLETVAADRDAKVLRGDIFELMRFVDHGETTVGDHLPVGALSDRGICAEEVMVHDDDVRFDGALSHPGDEAVVVARTLRPDAVFGRGGDLTPEGGIIWEVFDLSPVSGVGLFRPLVHDLEIRAVDRRAGLVAVASFSKTVKTKVVGTTFHVRGREAHI